METEQIGRVIDEKFKSEMLWAEVILKAAHWLQFNTDDPAIHQKSNDIQAALNLQMNDLVEIKKEFALLFGALYSDLEMKKAQCEILKHEALDLRVRLKSADQLIEVLTEK